MAQRDPPRSGTAVCPAGGPDAGPLCGLPFSAANERAGEKSAKAPAAATVPGVTVDWQRGVIEASASAAADLYAASADVARLKAERLARARAEDRLRRALAGMRTEPRLLARVPAGPAASMSAAPPSATSTTAATAAWSCGSACRFPSCRRLLIGTSEPLDLTAVPRAARLGGDCRRQPRKLTHAPIVSLRSPARCPLWLGIALSFASTAVRPELVSSAWAQPTAFEGAAMVPVPGQSDVVKARGQALTEAMTRALEQAVLRSCPRPGAASTWCPAEPATTSPPTACCKRARWPASFRFASRRRSICLACSAIWGEQPLRRRDSDDDLPVHDAGDPGGRRRAEAARAQLKATLPSVEIAPPAQCQPTPILRPAWCRGAADPDAQQYPG